MKEQKFRYLGPPSGATLRTGKKEQREVLLHPGRVVSLPAEHTYTRRLLARGLIVPVESAPPAPDPNVPPPSPQGDPVQGGSHHLSADGSERDDEKPKKKGGKRKGDD